MEAREVSMATRNSSNTAQQEERKNTKVVCCTDCLWAHLIQYGNDPVLAECLKRPNEGNGRFPYQREVASARWICPLYKHDNKVKEIEKREKAA